MKKLKSFLSIFLILAVGISLSAQKVGVVDTDYILAKLPQYIESEKRLNTQIDAWQKDIETLQADHDNKKERLENERILLVGDQLKQREKEVADLDKKIKEEIRDKFSTEGQINKYRANMIKPFQDQIWNAIKTVSDKNSLGIVIDKSNNISVIFLDKKFDYTDKVLDVLLKIDKENERKKEKERKQKEKEDKAAQKNDKNGRPIGNKPTEKTEEDKEQIAKKQQEAEEKKSAAEEEARLKKEEETRKKLEQQKRLKELIDKERGITPPKPPQKTTEATKTEEKTTTQPATKTPQQIKAEEEAAKKKEIQRKVQELINKEKGIKPKTSTPTKQTTIK